MAVSFGLFGGLLLRCAARRGWIRKGTPSYEKEHQGYEKEHQGYEKEHRRYEKEHQVTKRNTEVTWLRGPVKLIEVRVSEGGKVEEEGENRGSLFLAS